MAEMLRLGDHSIKVGSGATPRGGKDSYLPSGPYSLIRSQNVYNEGFSREGLAFISEEQAALLSGVAVEPGDVLINITGDSVARVCQVDISVLPARVNQHVSILRPNTRAIDATFLRYWLVTPEMQSRLLGLASAGATRPALTKSMLENLSVPALEMATQRSIANVLAVLDSKIALNREINKSLEAIAQTIFRDWFVDFSPVRRKMEGVTDPIAILGGLILDRGRAVEIASLFPGKFLSNSLPIGWAERSLLEQADWINGAAYKNMHFVGAHAVGLPVIKIAELKAGVTAQTKFTSTDLGARYRICNGELLFSWSGSPDTSIDAFLWTGGDAWLNQHIFAVRENGKRSKADLFILLKSLMPRFIEIAKDKQTTGLGHVTKNDMKRMLVPVAPTPVHQAYDELIEPLFQRIILALHENRTLMETRDYLLPRLMSGQVRVADAERMAG